MILRIPRGNTILDTSRLLSVHSASISLRPWTCQSLLCRLTNSFYKRESGRLLHSLIQQVGTTTWPSIDFRLGFDRSSDHEASNLPDHRIIGSPSRRGGRSSG